MKRVLCALSFLVLCSLVGGAEPTADEKQAKQAEDIDLMIQAAQLADVGKRLKSPEAYLAAGSLLLQLEARTKASGFGTLNVKPTVLDDKDQPVAGARVETQKALPLKDMAEDHFDAASALGAELKLGKALDEAIKLAKTRPYDTGARGALGGPQRLVGVVLLPGQTHEYPLRFAPPAAASIGYTSSGPVRFSFSGPGSVSFSGKDVAGRFNWVPPANADGKLYKVTIRNPSGKAAVAYTLLTN